MAAKPHHLYIAEILSSAAPLSNADFVSYSTDLLDDQVDLAVLKRTMIFLRVSQ